MMERPKKPKMLVVDDEPDNLDLLYRTFRRDFCVLRANSGIMALEMLATEGEVAVIISDQRMPEMKGTEFLSRTVPQFPDTMRIILTGFTDVEDLVEAINSGQVYKYITKPWDPNELKAVVQRAAETYDLLKQRTEELQQAQAQTALLSSIVQTARSAQSRQDCLEPIAHAFGQNFGACRCVMQLVEGEKLTTATGVYGATSDEDWLHQEPLVAVAIATAQMQVVSHSPEAAPATEHPTQLIAPITFQDQTLALLVLYWEQPHVLQDYELQLLHLCLQQAGMALMCVSQVSVNR